MRPCPPAANCADQPHRDAILLGERPSAPERARRIYDLLRFPFSQFGRPHLLSAWARTRTFLPIVSLATRHLIRLASRPVVIATRPLFRMQCGTATLSARRSAVPFPVRHVFGGSGPIDVIRRVVHHVAVAMSAVRLASRLRPIERLAHEAVHLAGDLSAVNTKDVCVIASAVPARRKNAASTYSPMVRHIPSHATQVRNRVRRRFVDLFPLLHRFVLPSFAYNTTDVGGQS